MKELRGSASGLVAAPAQRCLELVAAVESYPSWYPQTVRRAELIRVASGSEPALASATLHLGLGPLERDFELIVEIGVESERVTLTRLPHEPSDPEQLSLVWHIQEESPVRLGVELKALLDVPRLLPLHGAGDGVARGLLSAAVETLQRGR